MKIITDNINLNELAYDLAMLIFPFILGKMYNTIMSTAPLGIPFSQFFLMLAVYFLPLLIGRMYNNVFRDSPAAVKKLVIAILFAVTMFTFGNLLYLVLSTGGDDSMRGMFIMIAAMVLMIMGPIAGLAFQGGNTIPGDNTTKEEMPVQIFLVLFTIGLLPLFYMFMNAKEIFGVSNGILLFLICFGLCVADVILIMAVMLGFMGLTKLLTRIGIYNAIAFILRLMVPFSVSFILVFFNMYTDRLFTGSGGIHGAGSIALIVVMYIFTGVLPLRIIMMFAPPVKPVNVVMGIFSAAVMIWSVTLN